MDNKQRLKRHKRVRAKVSGTAKCPRLNVFRSSKHIYAQIIDDEQGNTLVSASTLEKDFDKAPSKVDAAVKVGELVGERALKKGIKSVVFDRGGYLYHGRVASVAEGARKSGLKF